MDSYLAIRWPLDLLSVLASGVVGFLLVFIIDWIRKPRIKMLGFEKVQVNFGVLYKLRFRLGGFNSPGVCRLSINWDNRSVFAKWDETPNPLDKDSITHFRPELVPLTFDQTLFHGIEYVVPIVIEINNHREVFSGWWFGKNDGYGLDPSLPQGFRITLTILGTMLYWSKSYNESEICQ